MSDIFKLYRPFYLTTNNVLITDKGQNEVYSVVIITACFFFSIFDFDTIPNRSGKYKYKIYKTATRNPGFSSQQQTWRVLENSSTPSKVLQYSIRLKHTDFFIGGRINLVIGPILKSNYSFCWSDRISTYIEGEMVGSQAPRSKLYRETEIWVIRGVIRFVFSFSLIKFLFSPGS